ncbi:MAG: ribbon-helix-helix protein, CopG family [Planctomycetes bacterium]|nr:ribbon-helix-helix protein, CopG family [Planctomycetota bacterium]
MKTISLKLPDSLRKALEEEARRRQLNTSELVRECLERELYKTSAARKLSCYDLIHESIGSVHSGLCDLATNPTYLGDFGK